MNNPFFWLGISVLLVAISLMALLLVAILALQELARAARSAEKLLDNLNRELPATLQDLRLTGKEISVLTEEMSSGMQSARNVVQQVDQGLIEAKLQAQKAQVTTRSLFAGATAALNVLMKPPRRRRRHPPIPPPVAPVAPVAPVETQQHTPQNTSRLHSHNQSTPTASSEPLPASLKNTNFEPKPQRAQPEELSP